LPIRRAALSFLKEEQINTNERNDAEGRSRRLPRI